MSNERKCQAITNSGKQCSRDALEGSNYCGLKKHQAQGQEVVVDAMEAVTEEMAVDAPKIKQVVRYINKEGVFGDEGSGL